MVTEQDVIDNAALFAGIINGASDIDIGDLPVTTSMAGTDPLHMQESGVDKKISKGAFEALLDEEMATGFKNLLIDGDFNYWNEGISQSVDGYGSSDMWFLNLSGATGVFSRQSHVNTNSKPYYSRLVTTVADDASGIQQKLKGNTFSGKNISVFLRLKYTSDIPNDLQVFILSDAPVVVGSGAIGSITNSWAWYRVDITVAAYSSTSHSQVRLQNQSNETFDLDIDKMRIIETPENLPDDVIPEWIKQDEDPLETLPLVQAYYKRISGNALSVPYSQGWGRSATLIDFSIPFMFVQDPTIITNITSISNVTSSATLVLTSPTYPIIQSRQGITTFRLDDIGFVAGDSYVLLILGAAWFDFDARY